MAKGAKTLLQPPEVREPADPKSGPHAQPVTPVPLLGLGAPQALAKPMDVSFLSTELPGGAPPPNCCSLKRTFACTNLLLLSQDDPDGAPDEASPGPCLRSPRHKDSAEPTVPPERPSLPPRLAH